MAWYGWFSSFYDQSLENLYAPHRQTLFDMAEGAPSSILDVACGTGQNLPFLTGRRSSGGTVTGVDLNEGMLKRAAKRVKEQQWTNVSFHEADVRALGVDDDPSTTGVPKTFDWVVCTLGLTVVPEWESVFRACWSRVKEGGQLLIMDVWAEERVIQTWMVEKMAQADLSRRVFEPLEAVSEGFQLVWLEAKPATFGGRLFAAVGTRPLSHSAAEGAATDEGALGVGAVEGGAVDEG